MRRAIRRPRRPWSSTIPTRETFRREPERADVLRLPGGPLIPLSAIVLSLGLLASATIENLAMGAAAVLVGSVIYAFRRKPA